MAITPASLKLILKAGGKGRAAAAGYPDLLINGTQAFDAIGELLEDVPQRDDSQKIMAWHGVQLPGIFESVAFFKALGYTLDVFDIAKIRGSEIILDLNYPSNEHEGQYDLVIDSGTCEHCFMIGQAIINLAQMVKEGGHIVQVFPLNAYNHGFYSVSPTLVKDFYEDNGFEVIDCFGLVGGSYFTFPVDFKRRFRGIPENSYMQLLVKRTKAQNIKLPVQFKYRSHQ